MKRFKHHDRPARPASKRAQRRVVTNGNNVADAYPHNAIDNPEARIHAEDGYPSRRKS